MTAAPCVREIGPEDEAALAAFFAENDRAEITAHFHPFPLDATTAHRIASAQRRDRYFAAFAGEVIAGFAMLRGWDEGFAVPSFGLLIDHRAHGRGLGRGLTEHALRIARELGSPRVRLTVHRGNERAVRLYERAGFRTTETRPDGGLVMFADLSHG